MQLVYVLLSPKLYLWIEDRFGWQSYLHGG